MKNFINYQNPMNKQNNFDIQQNYNYQNYFNNLNNNLYEPYQGFIRGNLFENLYDQYKITRPYEVKPMNEQAEILTYIDSLGFATHDLNLYLDNFPNDKEMIKKFNNYNQELNKAINDYEKSYGPLLVNSENNNTWAWNNRPWPWEN